MKTKSFLLFLVAMLFIACGQSVNNDRTEPVGEVDYELVGNITSDSAFTQSVLTDMGFDEYGILPLDSIEARAVFNRLLLLEKALKQTTVVFHDYEVDINRTTTQFPAGAFDDNFYAYDGVEYRMIAQRDPNYWAHLSLILPKWGVDTSHEMDIIIRLNEEGDVLGGRLFVLRSDLSKAVPNKSDDDPNFIFWMRDKSEEWKLQDSFIGMFEELVPHVATKPS